MQSKKLKPISQLNFNKPKMIKISQIQVIK